MTTEWLENSIDKLGASLGGFVYRKNLLFNDSLESKPLGEVTRRTIAKVSSFPIREWHQVTANGPAGRFETAFLVYRWHDFSVPTLLFIHASGEQPHNFGRFSSNSFKSIFSEGFSEKLNKKVNLIALRAPFHESSQGEYIKALSQMKNYVGMLGSTTALLHALAHNLKEKGCPRVYGVGVSLGGWVVNLHRAYFGKLVDKYIPIMAGTRLDNVFGASCYRKLTAKSAWSRPERLRELLDFQEDFCSNKDQNCYPLLARYDQFVDFYTQKKGYEGMALEVIDKGHFTGMLSVKAFRHHIQRFVDD